MDLIIFAVGFLVTMTVIYGVFSQVPLEISPPEDVTYKSPE
jgi:hypothetical protein